MAAPFGRPRTQQRAACAAVGVVALGAMSLLLATSGAPAAGADPACPNESLRVGASAHLPDCRAYEMVSPPDKNGGEIMGDTARVRPSVDGNAVAFASFSAFSDAIGTGIVVDYMSIRTPDGWSTHSITPPQSALPSNSILNQQATYMGEFSRDLSSGVFRAFSALTDTPNVAKARNLYLRGDLRTPGAGTYSLLTQAATPQLTSSVVPAIADASDDFSHVIFESKRNLIAGVSGTAPKLYEWADGTLRLAGTLPDGSPALCPTSTACSAAGTGASGPVSSLTQDTMSRDGTRIFFTSPVSGNADPVEGSQLYMRVDGTTTVQLSRSESSSSPGEPRAARFQAATPDGDKVFFLSNQPLTDDADASSNLYAYDASRPDDDSDNLTLLSPGGSAEVGGVLGISEDGTYVYFSANGRLTPEAPQTVAPKLYLWHAGAVSYIGEFGTPDDAENNFTQVPFTLAQRTSRVTPDGTHLIFGARDGTKFTGFQHSTDCGGAPCYEVYLYDTESNGGNGQLRCASCNQSGASATSDAGGFIRVGLGGVPRTSHLNHPLSDDGRRVFFSSSERLVPGDRNGATLDVYEYDTESTALHLITTGKSTENSYFMDATASGGDIFFLTRDRLSVSDVDTGYDLYDARIGGGVPTPAPIPVSCVGEACRGPLGFAPVAPQPATSATDGPGNRRSVRKKNRLRRKHKHRDRQRRSHHESKQSTRAQREAANDE